MRRAAGVAGLVLAVVAALAAGPAPAAAASSEVFGGYSYARNGGQGYHGWNAGFTFGLGARLGLTADLAGHYGSDGSADLSLFSYMAGPQLTLIEGRTRVFVHALAGRVRSKASFSPVSGIEISETSTDIGVLLGGGIDHALGERLRLRLGADYYGLDSTPDWQHQPRASLGLAYRF